MQLSNDDRDINVFSQLKAKRDLMSVNEKLLSSDGVVDIARQIGISFPYESLSPETLDDFIGALNVIDDERAVLRRALQFIAAGQCDLDQGDTPYKHIPIHSEAIDPVTAYIESIRYLDAYLTYGGKYNRIAAQLMSQASHHFIDHSWSESWREAVRLAEEFEERTTPIIDGDRNSDDRIIPKDRFSSLHVIVVDSSYNVVSPFSLLPVKKSSFVESPLFSRRVYRGIDNKRKEFSEIAFPNFNHEDKKQLKNIEVHHYGCVLPLPDLYREAKFTIHFSVENSALSLSVLTQQDKKLLRGTIVESSRALDHSVEIFKPDQLSDDEKYFAASAYPPKKNNLSDKAILILEPEGQLPRIVVIHPIAISRRGPKVSPERYVKNIE